MKVKFDHGIRENETLIREELRIEDLSKRIQEQNEYALHQAPASYSELPLMCLKSIIRGPT
jgi:hypothetical protein